MVTWLLLHHYTLISPRGNNQGQPPLVRLRRSSATPSVDKSTDILPVMVDFLWYPLERWNNEIQCSHEIAPYSVWTNLQGFNLSQQIFHLTVLSWIQENRAKRLSQGLDTASRQNWVCYVADDFQRQKIGRKFGHHGPPLCKLRWLERRNMIKSCKEMS